jgi:hypothetical protein
LDLRKHRTVSDLVGVLTPRALDVIAGLLGAIAGLGPGLAKDLAQAKSGLDPIALRYVVLRIAASRAALRSETSAEARRRQGARRGRPNLDRIRFDDAQALIWRALYDACELRAGFYEGAVNRRIAHPDEPNDFLEECRDIDRDLVGLGEMFEQRVKIAARRWEQRARRARGRP